LSRNRAVKRTHRLRSEGAGFKVRAFAILTTAGAD
jgi:hypothetical protein